jgi:hypothetical protein
MKINALSMRNEVRRILGWDMQDAKRKEQAKLYRQQQIDQAYERISRQSNGYDFLKTGDVVTLYVTKFRVRVKCGLKFIQQIHSDGHLGKPQLLARDTTFKKVTS